MASATKFDLPMEPMKHGALEVVFHYSKAAYNTEAGAIHLDMEFKLPEEFGISQRDMLQHLFSAFQLMVTDVDNRPKGQFGLINQPTIAIGDRVTSVVGECPDRPATMTMVFKRSDFPFEDTSIVVAETNNPQKKLTIVEHLRDFIAEALPEVVDSAADGAAKTDKFKEFAKSLSLEDEAKLRELAVQLLSDVDDVKS